MNTMNELRKAIKPLGFTVRTKSYSHGAHATYEAIGGAKLTHNVFTPDQLTKWRPLFAWREAHREELKALREKTGVIGLL